MRDPPQERVLLSLLSKLFCFPARKKKKANFPIRARDSFGHRETRVWVTYVLRQKPKWVCLD